METWQGDVSCVQKQFLTLAQAPLPGPFLGIGLNGPMHIRDQLPDIWSLPAKEGPEHLKIVAIYCTLTIATNYA